MARGFDRRQLLHGGCALFALACGGDTTTPPTDSGDPTTPPDDHTGTTETPFAGYPCDQAVTPDGTFTELPFTDYPDLAEVGGWYGVTAGGKSIVVAHVATDCYSAIDRACAHEGVEINYDDLGKRFTCPRHGAVYAPDGSKVSGPQATGLPRYSCVRQGDSVFVKVV
jgi:nitrite reductase/ring-hydroxylating ferredoxin subunit